MKCPQDLATTSGAVPFNLCTREWEMWKEVAASTSNNEDLAWAIAAIERLIFGNLRGSLIPRLLKQWELTSPLTTSRTRGGTRAMLSLSGYARVWLVNFRVQVVMHACYVGETRQPTFLFTSSRALTFRQAFERFRHLQSSESCRTSCTPDCFARSWTLQLLSTK